MGGAFKRERLIELLKRAEQLLQDDGYDSESDAVEEARCRIERPADFKDFPIDENIPQS